MIKCSKCGYIGPESEFPKGHDLFQFEYIAGCPKCDNKQTLAQASMRVLTHENTFTYVSAAQPAPRKEGKAK